MTCYRKQRVEWRLKTRVFNLVAAGRVGIITSGAGMFAEKAETSCFSLAISKDQKKYPGSSRGKDFAGFGNG